MGDILSWYALGVFGGGLILAGLAAVIIGPRESWCVRYTHPNSPGEYFYSTHMTKRQAQNYAFMFDGIAMKVRDVPDD